VLPFTNLSGDFDQEYFADGMVEEIITGLSRFRWLFVIARNSNFAYKGRAVDVKQVGRELGATYSKAVSGNRAIGSALQGNLSMPHPRHIFGRIVSKVRSKDGFELQDQVAARVVGAIAPRLRQAEIERARRKPTESLDAYDLFLRGMANFYKWTREGTDEALGLFYRAIERDPDFSLAYAAAAGCFSRRKLFGWVIDREQEVAEARRLALRAVKLGKDDATVHCFSGVALAYVSRNLEDGAAFIDRALFLNPNLASAWCYSGWVNLWLGEPDRAIESFAHAMRLSPMDSTLFTLQHGIAHAHFFAGRYDKALASAKMALRERPDGYSALPIAAAISVLVGRGKEAKRLMARLLEIDPALRISNFENVVGPWQPEDLSKYKD